MSVCIFQMLQQSFFLSGSLFGPIWGYTFVLESLTPPPPRPRLGCFGVQDFLEAQTQFIFGCSLFGVRGRWGERVGPALGLGWRIQLKDQTQSIDACCTALMRPEVSRTQQEEAARCWKNFVDGLGTLWMILMQSSGQPGTRRKERGK